MGMLSQWKVFAPDATGHAALHSTFINDLSASPMVSGAEPPWAGQVLMSPGVIPATIQKCPHCKPVLRRVTFPRES